MYQYHLTIPTHSPERVARELDKISLQNINNEHFTINPEDITKPTYVKVRPTESDYIRSATNVFIRTKRAPTQENKNLEPALQEILDDLCAT